MYRFFHNTEYSNPKAYSKFNFLPSSVDHDNYDQKEEEEEEKDENSYQSTKSSISKVHPSSSSFNQQSKQISFSNFKSSLSMRRDLISPFLKIQSKFQKMVYMILCLFLREILYIDGVLKNLLFFNFLQISFKISQK